MADHRRQMAFAPLAMAVSAIIFLSSRSFQYKNLAATTSVRTRNVFHSNIVSARLRRGAFAHRSIQERHADCSAMVVPNIPGTLTELQEDSGTNERFIFCGGKGGVGKTTTAAAIAVKLAEDGHSTLVVSTDPAHSLGDAFDENLSGGSPISIGADLGIPLYGMEIDAEDALKSFSEAAANLNFTALAVEAGISPDLMETLGVADLLKDLNGLFENPPPGVDEIVAIAQVVKLVKSGLLDGEKIDRIVFDTAPTGHTLRLLSLPTFLDGFIAQAIKLRARVGGLINSITTMMGMDNKFENQLGRVVEKLEVFQRDMQSLKKLLNDPVVTEFVVVTIPTTMAVKESERLLDSLGKAKITTKHMVVNKILSQNDNSYLDMIKQGQNLCLDRLDALSARGIEITKVPYFNSEITGVPSLMHMANVAFESGWEDVSPQNKVSAAEESMEEKLRRLEMEVDQEASGPQEPKFIIMGGKGGVGKTSSSSALAVDLARKGARTVVVSTDPAHSLGDSLQMSLSGALQEVQGIEASGDGCLYAIEVDTEGAIRNFREAITDLVNKKKARGGSADMLSQLQLEDFLQTLENPPPGADELVALAQMLKIVDQGTPGVGRPFDYVVVDTAPTGHTLRLLSLPQFLDKFFARLRSVRDKVSGASALLSMFMPADDGTPDPLDIPEVEPVDRLQDFQNNMQRVTKLLKDSKNSQFCIVTIPTQLAVAETERLVDALNAEGITVNHIIANQVIGSGEESADVYLNRIQLEQEIMLNQVESIAAREGLNVVKVPYFDVEIRSIFGLKVLADVLFPEPVG